MVDEMKALLYLFVFLSAGCATIDKKSIIGHGGIQSMKLELRKRKNEKVDGMKVQYSDSVVERNVGPNGEDEGGDVVYDVKFNSDGEEKTVQLLDSSIKTSDAFELVFQKKIRLLSIKEQDQAGHPEVIVISIENE